MTKSLITHVMLDISCSNENLGPNPDYAWIPLTPEYVVEILKYMDLVARLYKKDNHLYCLKRWDYGAQFVSWFEHLETIRDVRDRIASDIPRGEPILLSVELELPDTAFVRVECMTIQISHNDVWWTAYIKHTSDRVESMRISKKVLRDIQRRFKS